MLKWIKKLLKQLWSFLKKLWPILLILGIMLFFLNPVLFMTIISTAGSWLAAIPGLLASASGWVIGLFEGLSFWEACAAIVGASFLLDPKGTSKAISNVVDAAGDAAADIAGSVTESIFSSPAVLMVGAGVAAYFLLRKKDSVVVVGDGRDNGKAEDDIVIADSNIDKEPVYGT